MALSYTTGMLSFGGADMEYIRFGQGEKTFVILPGLSIGSLIPLAERIAAAYAAFAEEYAVYLFERRKNPPGVYRIEDMASDTFGAFEALGLRDIDLFGVSQGGMIAQVIAAEHPETVRKLVLASTLSRVSREQEESLSLWIENAEKGRRLKTGKLFAKAIYSEDFFRKFRLPLLLSTLKASREDLRRFAFFARACLGFSCYERLDRIACPALVLGAENDKVTGAAASLEIAQKLGCECFLYPAPYGHAVYDEAPDFKERILRFLAQ